MRISTFYKIFNYFSNFNLPKISFTLNFPKSTHGSELEDIDYLITSCSPLLSSSQNDFQTINQLKIGMNVSLRESKVNFIWSQNLSLWGKIAPHWLPRIQSQLHMKSNFVFVRQNCTQLTAENQETFLGFSSGITIKDLSNELPTKKRQRHSSITCIDRSPEHPNTIFRGWKKWLYQYWPFPSNQCSSKTTDKFIIHIKHWMHKMPMELMVCLQRGLNIPSALKELKEGSPRKQIWTFGLYDNLRFKLLHAYNSGISKRYDDDERISSLRIG